MRPRPFSRKLSSFSATLAALLASHSAQAATVKYDTTSADWSVATQWTSNTLPTTIDEALIDNSIVTIPATLTGGTTGLTFGDLIFNSSTLTLFRQSGASGVTLTLSGGGGSTAAIAAGGASGDLLVFGTNVTSAFNFGGGSGGGKMVITLGTYGNFDIVNSGATANFIGYVINGTGGINKTGAGTLVLTPSNTTATYTGDTKVSGGTLQVGNNLILQSSVFDTSGGGSLTFSSGITTPTFGGLKSSTNLTLASTITALTLNPGTGVTANFTGALSGGATGLTLTKSGTGTQILGVSQSYTGTTTVSAGVLELDHATALPGGIGSTGGTSALTFGGGVLGLGAGDFTRSLAAAGTAAGANFTQAGGWAAYGADRVVNLGGASTTIIVATANTGLNSKTLILGASTATHMVDFQNPLNFGTSARTVQADDGAAAIDGKLSGNLTGTSLGGLTKTGAGTLLLSGSNSYTGLTTVTAGTLLTTNAAAQAGYSTAAKVVFNGGTIGVQVGGSGWTTTQVNTLLTNATKTNGALGIDTTNGSHTQWTDFTTTNFGSALGLTKLGANTLTLSGTGNTYTGATTISAGTVSAGNIVVSGGSSNLGNATTAVTLGSAAAQGTLSYTGNSDTYSRGFTVGGAGGGRLDVTTSGQTLTVGTGDVTGTGLFTVGGAGNATISANLTHTGGLTKADAGTLTLSGANTYGGATSVAGGRLLVNNTSGSGTGTGTVSVALGATLGGAGVIGGAVIVDGKLSPGASIAKLTVGGDLTFDTGSTFVYEMNHLAAVAEAADLQVVFGDGTGNSVTLAQGFGEMVHLNLTDLAETGGTFAANTTLSLIQYVGNWNGGFFTYGSEALGDGEAFTDAYSNHWTIRYGADSGGLNFATSISGSHFVTLSNLTSIPEPDSLLALGCLVGSGICLRSRRRCPA